MVGYGSELINAKKLALNLGIEESVQFLGKRGWLEVQEIISRGQVFLFTSLRESFGAQILEAAAIGIPVVFLENGGASDWLRKYDWLGVDIGKPQETIENLATKILSVLEMPDSEWYQISNNLKMFAKSNTVENKNLEIQKMYNEIIHFS